MATDTQDTDGFVTLNGLAKGLGVDWHTAKKHADAGLFKPVARGPNEGKYDLARCRELYEAARDPDAALKGALGGQAVSGKGVADVSTSQLLRARTAGATIKAQREQIELQRLRGELISKEDARRAARAVVTVVCERIEGAASMIGVRVVGCTSAADAERIAREILRGVRAEVAGIADAIEGVGADATATA